MSHFRDLCQLNEQVEKKRAEATRILRNQAVRLVEYYEKWLGLPADRWVDHNGGLHPYVETGLPCSDPESFSALSVHQIGTLPDAPLSMAVRTWLKSEDSGVPVNIVLNLTLYSVDDNGISIDVQVGYDNPIRVTISKSDKGAWAEVMISMKRHIQAALKKRYPSAYL